MLPCMSSGCRDSGERLPKTERHQQFAIILKDWERTMHALSVFRACTRALLLSRSLFSFPVFSLNSAFSPALLAVRSSLPPCLSPSFPPPSLPPAMRSAVRCAVLSLALLALLLSPAQADDHSHEVSARSRQRSRVQSESAQPTTSLTDPVPCLLPARSDSLAVAVAASALVRGWRRGHALVQQSRTVSQSAGNLRLHFTAMV